jgi:hypothetical protein
MQEHTKRVAKAFESGWLELVAPKAPGWIEKATIGSVQKIRFEIVVFPISITFICLKVGWEIAI